MLESSNSITPSDRKGPSVSIILPTYNRAWFLPQALESIRAQQFTDWELIVVDDGSTDETPELIPKLIAEVVQPTKYIQQRNQGAYAARNTGVDHSTGEYVAFYDSDDLWLAHHLQSCVTALDENVDVDWVYGAGRIVDMTRGIVTCDNCFYPKGRPRPFLSIGTQRTDRLIVLAGPEAVRCQINSGLYCGLQASMIRRRLLERHRLPTGPIAEAVGDQLFAISCLQGGARLGCLDRVHFDFRVHESNSSAAGCVDDPERQRRVVEMTAAGYEGIFFDTRWLPWERRALRRRLQREYFWKLGYATLWMTGHRTEALQMFRRGLYYWPWDWRCWKTYSLAKARCILTRANS